VRLKLAKSQSSPSQRNQQVAQLSQRDRAALWVSLAKSGLELGNNILRTLLQPLWRNWTAKRSNSVKKCKIRDVTPFKVIQSHSRSSTSVLIESPYATSYIYRHPISFRSYHFYRAAWNADAV